MSENTVSKFRAAMRANGFEISFSMAAKILLDAGIVKLEHGPSGSGYVRTSAEESK